MSLEQFFLAGLGIGCGVLGWLGRELWGAVQKLRTDLDALRVHIAQDYVRQDRLDKALAPISEALRRIEDALLHKVDKP